MHRLWTVFITLSFSALAAMAQKANVFTDGIFQYSVNHLYEGGAKLANGDSTVTVTHAYRNDLSTPLVENHVLVIPGKVVHGGYEYAVTNIGQGAFTRFRDVRHVVISEGICHIDSYAFASCENLQTITIPSSVSHIAANAFASCPELREINVDERNRSYDSRGNCNAIIETETEKLVLGCHATRIPAGVKCIGGGAFEGCVKLDSITIPEGVERLEAAVFRGCVRLRHVGLPLTLKSIYASSLFENCTNLASIHIPANVSTIEGDQWGSNMFGHCTTLDSIVVDSRNKTFDSRGGCNAIIETATDKLLYGCGNTDIPEGIQEIGTAAFGYTPVSHVYIPASVTRIQEGAFKGCTLCTSLTVDEENPVYDSRGNCNAIIETKTNTLVSGCRATTFPANVTTIGPSAFAGIPMPQTLIIPEGIREIGNSAFIACKGLQTVFLPESLEKLGVQAFASCQSLEEIHWKKSVEEIPDFAFTRCRSLYIVEIPEGTKRLGDFAFEGCERLCFVSLPSSLEHIHKTAFKGCPCDSLVQQKYSSKFAKQQKNSK